LSVQMTAARREPRWRRSDQSRAVTGAPEP
jgi:hypothetical protein